MLRVAVEDRHGERTETFAAQVLTIGRAPYAQVAIQLDGVTRQHARLYVLGRGRVLVRDLASTNGTFVGGVRVDHAAGGRLLAPDDVVDLGEAQVARVRVSWEPLRLDPPRDEAERGLLEALARSPSDASTRAVYGDWLEEHDEPGRAEYLRIMTAVAGRAETEPALGHRLARLAASIPAAWRARVATGPIVPESCGARRRGASTPCPARWEAFEPTDTEDFRRCGACSDEVRWCTTEAEAAWLAERAPTEAPPIALERGAPMRP